MLGVVGWHVTRFKLPGVICRRGLSGNWSVQRRGDRGFRVVIGVICWRSVITFCLPCSSRRRTTFFRVHWAYCVFVVRGR